MGATPTVGDSIERLALQRLLDHIHAERRRGLSAFPLSELAEATDLDPTTVEAAMTQLETGGPYRVDRMEPEYGERCWHVRGSADELGNWSADAWTVRS